MGVAASKRAMREATSSSETTGTCAAESDPKPKCSKRASPNSHPHSAHLSRNQQSGLLILGFIRLIFFVACPFKFLKALSQTFHHFRDFPPPKKQDYDKNDNNQFPAARNSEEN